MRACVRACVRAWVRACVRGCVLGCVGSRAWVCRRLRLRLRLHLCLCLPVPGHVPGWSFSGRFFHIHATSGSIRCCAVGLCDGVGYLRFGLFGLHMGRPCTSSRPVRQSDTGFTTCKQRRYHPAIHNELGAPADRQLDHRNYIRCKIHSGQHTGPLLAPLRGRGQCYQNCGARVSSIRLYFTLLSPPLSAGP